MATPQIQNYIRRKFQWVSQHYQAHTVIEKTCANSLRMEFVERTLTEPKFIFIHRDGVDAVASAMSRWRAKLDLMYVLRKAWFVPVGDLPYHFYRYFLNRVSRIHSPGHRLSSWGPVLPDMEVLKARHDLPELCALQWRGCVDAALDSFEKLPDERILRVGYEELVRGKVEQISRIAGFIGVEPDDLLESSYLDNISESSIGKGYATMPDDVVSRILTLIEPTMARLGYR
jgi:hypothetical protein